MQNKVSKIFASLVAYDAKQIAVATSGGADSMALALLLQEYCKEHHITLHALHVNHRLRAEAGAEAQMVQQWLQHRGIATHILNPTTSIAEMRGNLMQNARHVRYELMLEHCTQHGISQLCVAHHAQDQAETFLMRLGRASGVAGLAAMQTKTRMQNITILRPLLECCKSDLIAYLQAQNQQWIEDPTNDNEQYTRTKMRSLLPILEQAGISAQRIMQSTQHLARAADFLQQHAHEWLEQNNCWQHLHISIPIQPWLKLHHEMQLRTLSAALRAMQPHKPELRYEKLQALRLAMLSPDGFKDRTLQHCCIKAQKNLYIISLEPLKN